MSSQKLPSHNIKGDIKIGADCVICEKVYLRGDITIGAGTIVHPKAEIIAEAGPIIIGENNIIEDGAVILNKVVDTASGSTPVMIIGNFNVFEVYSHTEALKVGDNNVLESKCFVGRDVVLSNNCVIGAACKLSFPEVLPEKTTVYGSDCHRRISQAHQPQVLQLDYLKKLLPNYHHTVKKVKKLKEANVSPLTSHK